MVVISETVLILAGGTAVLSILFGMRVAMRALAGAAAAPRSDGGQAAGGSGTPDVAGVIALPPLIVLGFLAAAAVLEAIVPLPVPVTHSLAWYVPGAILAAGGFVIIAIGTRLFAAAGTNVPPTLPTTALVVDGIYRRTRNPLYLGMTLIYVSLGIAARSLWEIGLVVPLLWVINVGVVKREERYLERKFGSARKINLSSPGLIVRAQPKSKEKEVILEAREVASSLISLPVETGVEFSVRVDQNVGLHYPLVKYVTKREVLPTAGGVRAKHLKLRKILTHFRSHSRGTMAKLRAKVENERVAGNDVGRPVLERLVKDGILVPDGSFYFLEPSKVDQFLGVSWMRLREGVVNQKLVEYLQSIK